MDELLKYLVSTLVENKDAVEVEKVEDENSISYKVKVDENDVGRVIGKNGKTASSIRTIMRSVCGKTHKKISVSFED